MATLAAATAAAELGGGPGSATNGSVLATVTDYSILVVVGALRPVGLLERLLLQIDAGVRCWSVDLDVSVLDQQLKLFVSRHSAFLSEHVPGQRTLHHGGDVLDTQVVLSPSLDFVCSEVQQLLSSPSRHKLLILAGQFVEDSGDLVLQKGRFSPNHLLHIFREEEVRACSSVRPAAASSLTLRCPDYGLWKDSGLREKLHSFATVHINPPPFFPQMEGLHEFTEYLSESLEPDSPFQLLEPPSTVGFLKLSRPCCYIFPGGRGDAAFFSVNGFNLLVNGGSDPRSCFWKLVRHLDRIDSVLLTHVGVDNLPGLNSLLLRKTAEQQLPAGEEQLKQLISPEIGVVFLNAPDSLTVEEEPSLLRSCDELALTLQHLRRLHIQPHSLSARTGTGMEPVILFQKMGVGLLELYVLNPLSGSKSLETFMQMWPNISSSSTELPLTCLASICALLVWHPVCPQEKIVRVLFPGCTPQTNLLEGLHKISKLPFLKQPVVRLKDLETPKSEKEAKTESNESIQVQGKDVRPGRSLQKEELAHADAKRKEVKPKPKGTSEAAPKEKKDGSERLKLKDNEAKSKLMRPVRKTGPKKDAANEDKKEAKDEKTSSAAETKKEVGGDRKLGAPEAKLKRDLKPEPKKDGRKDVRTDGNKSTKAGSKDGKKAAGLLGGASEPKKAEAKTPSLKRDAALPKKAAAGQKSHKEVPPPRRAAPQAAGQQPEPYREANGSSCLARSPPDKLERLQAGPHVGGASVCLSSDFGDDSPRLVDLVPGAPAPPGGASAGARALPLNGHVASCNGLGGGVHVHELSELGSAAPHDVDLCLVSPCEFHHPHQPPAGTPAAPPPSRPPEGPGSERPSGGPPNSGPGSDWDLLLSTQPRSPTAANVDSDPSPSVTPSGLPLDQSPPSAPPGVQLSLDPPAAPIKDLPPLPPQPGACMADVESKNMKTAAARNRKPPGAAQRGTWSSSGRSKLSSSGSSILSTSASGRAVPSGSGAPAVYVDLAYLPSGPAASTLDAEFFRRLRSRHYIISGDDEVKAAAMTSILDALLEGKSSWPELQVTLIPTFDSLPMHDWYQEAHDRLGELLITVLGSNSTVAMQEETFPACKVEF